MSDSDVFEGLAVFVAERGDLLLARATLLTGSRAAGEDLLQAALERLMRQWRRVQGDPEGYLRRTMYNLAIDQWRYRSRRPEVFAHVEPPGVADATDAIALRRALVEVLTLLPPRQRAVLVLRYWEELTEAEAAATLGCSVGTVRSTTSKALARLREITVGWSDADADGPRDRNGVPR